MAIAPTGSGKTLAYILPLYMKLREHQTGGLRGTVSPYFGTYLNDSYHIRSYNRTRRSDLQVRVPIIAEYITLNREFLYLNHGLENHLHVKMIHNVSNQLKTFKEQEGTYDVLITTPLKFIKLFTKDVSLLSTVQYVMIDEVDRYFELVKTLGKQPFVNSI